MTKHDDWALYTKEIPSPQPWIDASWYFLIGAVLQRRVWCGGFDNSGVFPNPFYAFVGDAGSGKSLSVSAMQDLITIQRPPEVTDSDLESELRAEHNDKHYDGNSKPLIHLAPNSTTFESMTKEIAGTAFLHRYNDEAGKKRMYAHSSVAFILDELTSIFKHHSEDLTEFLNQAYNSGKRYVRKLKQGGTDVCTNICVSMIGNTTPMKFRAMLTKEVITGGFMSRTVIVWGDTPRHGVFLIPKLTPAQLAAKERLQKHLLILSTVYGEMQFEPGLFDWCNQLFVHDAHKVRTNKHKSLDEYYRRKNQHFMKLMMAVHFSEHVDNVLTFADAHKALELLAGWERNMHLPYVGMGRNETAVLAEEVAAACVTPTTKRDLYAKFFSAFKSVREFDENIEALKSMGRITEKTINGIRHYERIN
jgi:hypothetical protein